MRRCITCHVAIAAICIWVGPARGEHAKIQLEVATPRGQVTAFVEPDPAGVGEEPEARR